MPVTIRDVARLAGVSPMTVSRVINGGQNVLQETSQRVQQAIAELGYVPNSLARGLSGQRTRTLALILPDVANPFFTRIVQGAEAVAREAGYQIILCNTDGQLEREAASLQAMLAYRVEGIVIAPVGDTSQGQLSQMAGYGVPLVLVDRAVAAVEGDLVQGDSVGDARRLVQLLTDSGHQRIAMIAGQSYVSTSRDRQAGYRQALEAANLAFDPALVVPSEFDIESGYRATQRLLWLKERPTAIFAVNNLVAVGAVRALREHRLATPDDVALVCFDDIDYASLLCPFLTVMAQPAESYGTIATDMLLERIGGQSNEPSRRVVLSAELIVRESCGTRRTQAYG
ncbi:MAG: LacI family transcriptional regulator [Chloroflexaceae bacterium]|nr:LacI family transcriptional regulator [Chloroflexaceae bacterium]